jgi:xylan 1,4-beta-xylosidase
LRDELGMQRMRVHGIFCDDLGTCREGPGGIEYNWSGVDAVLDGIRAGGFAPWIMLSYMPRVLAANPRQTLHSRFISSPPRDYGKWADLVRALAVHLMERYGRDEVLSWYFEVWNEPDLHLRMADFWHGKLEDYFQLYDAAADALKSVNPGLRVGGPGAGTLPTIEAFLRHVTQWSRQRSLDFLSMHLYGSGLVDLRPLLKRYGLDHVKVHYTEWGISGRKGDAVHDLPYAAAWIARVLIESHDQMDGAGYWTGEDTIEGQRQKAPFAGGYGLVAGHGLRKPAFWSFALLHRLGPEQLAVEGSGDGLGGCVHPLAACRGRESIQILVTNATYDHTKARGCEELCRQVELRVKGLAREAYRIRHLRVDAAHTNAFGAWERAGRPPRPTEGELAAIRGCDRIEPYEPDVKAEPDAAGELRLRFELPMPAVSLIEIDRLPAQDVTL